MPVLSAMSDKFMFDPSIIFENVLYGNYIQKFMDDRIDIMSHEHLTRYVTFKRPPLGHMIHTSERLSNSEKIRRIIKILAGKSTLGLIVGKRRSGKTCLAFWILEQVHEHYPDKPLCFNGIIDEALVPDYITIIGDIEDAPTGSLIVLDEASIRFNPRRAMSLENIHETMKLVVTGHKDLSVLYLTQHSSLVDLNIFRLADVFFFKKLSMSDLGMDVEDRRTVLKPLGPFLQLMSPKGKEVEFRETMFIDDEHNGWLFENDKPTFWEEALSKTYRKMGYMEACQYIKKCAKDGLRLRRIKNDLMVRDIEMSETEIKSIMDTNLRVLRRDYEASEKYLAKEVKKR